MKTALFRADGSHWLGLGHIMRCLAFADGLRGVGVESLFAVRDYEPQVLELVRRNGYEMAKIDHNATLVEDAAVVSALSSRYRVGLIVLDLYNPDSRANPDYYQYPKALKGAGAFMIALDEPVREDSPFDMQIIPYYGEKRDGYRSCGGTRLLLGPAYFIFRKEFVRAVGVKREVRENARNIMVSMGGSDPLNLTGKVAGALRRLSSPNLRIILGPGFALSARKAIAGALAGFNGDCEFIVGSDTLADVMLWADLAITGGGLTKYEMALAGTPCITISNNGEEARGTAEFEKGGSTRYLGLATEVTEEDIAGAVNDLLKDRALRVKMSESGRKLVDGKGMERIIAEIPRSVLV